MNIKYVWANRWLNETEKRPMAEWICVPILKEANNVVHTREDGVFSFYFTAEQVKESKLPCNGDVPRLNGDGYFAISRVEYVGDQKGDGWLYIDDGELPPDTNELVAVVSSFRPQQTHMAYAKEVRLDCMANGKPICWKPIPPPLYTPNEETA